MKDTKRKYQRAFIPTDPQGKHRSQIEIMNWKVELEAKKKQERRQAVMGWITTISSVIAALAAVAGVLIQLLSGK